MKKLQGIASAGAFYLIVAGGIFYFLFPVYWMVLSSLKTPSTFFDVTYLPRDISLRAYRSALADPGFMRPLLNSVVVMAAVVLLTLVIGSLGGYALGRYAFRGRSALRYVLLGLLAFPQITLLGGLFVLFTNPCSVVGLECRQFQIYNTLWSMILADLLLTLPLTIWFLSVYFRQIPQEIEDSAAVDGATAFQTFARIMLPLATPALVTVGILSAIFVWNEFLFALTFTLTERSRLVSIAIANYGMRGMDALISLAASTIAMTPVLLLVLLFQNRIAQGLSGFSTKPRISLLD